MCLGPVELAAAGVSIALFNLASRITIFPLVSITTSFVAEENTIENINTAAAEKQFSENIKAKSNEVMPDDHLLQDIEKGASKENETPTESSAARVHTNELVTNNRDGTFCGSLALPLWCYICSMSVHVMNLLYHAMDTC